MGVKGGPEPVTKQNRTTNLSVLLLLLVIVLCASYLLRMDNQVPQLEYSQVRQLFEQEKVESVTFPDEHTLELHLREKVKSLGDTDTVRYRIYDFAIFYEDLNDLIVEQKAAGIITSYDYPAAPTTNWLTTLLPYVLVAVVLGLLWYFLIVRAQGGGMGPDKMAKFGTARTRTLTDKDRKITFADVASYGMSEKLGTVSFESGHDEVFIGRTMSQGRSYSEAVAAQIDEEVKDLVGSAYERCRKILDENRDKLETVARYLLEHETMERDAFLAVFRTPEVPASV
jgi:ATP-dependent Zn protease